MLIASPLAGVWDEKGPWLPVPYIDTKRRREVVCSQNISLAQE